MKATPTTPEQAARALAELETVLPSVFACARAWLASKGDKPSGGRAGTGESFGQIVKRLREAAGLTGAQLATKAGVSRQFIQKLESGTQNDPKFTVVCRLADALGVAVEELRT